MVYDLLIDFFRLIAAVIASLVSLVIPTKKYELQNKIVFVSGAGRGIGREIALKFSAKGSVVVCVDINQANVEETCDMIRKAGGNAYAYMRDITSYSTVKELARTVQQEVGDVDVLVNNAGVLFGGQLMDLTEQQIRKTFDVNVLSHFWTVKEFLPAMMRRNEGHIVTIASMAGLVGCAELCDYSASKFAAVGFTESVRAELLQAGKTGIGLTTVCPLFVNTNMIDNMSWHSRLASYKPLDPAYVAQQVVSATQYGWPIFSLPNYMLWIVGYMYIIPYRVRYVLSSIMHVNMHVDHKKAT